MAKNLPRLVDAADKVELQDTAFTTDVLGRYICNTWEEATQNGGTGFDAVVIGAGMFGAYCAEKIYRHANVRVLVLDAGSLLVTEHVQNLSRIGLNAAGPIKVESTNQDPGARENVWGNPWRSQTPFPGLAYCLGGRSLYWGGWSPQLTDADLAQWPAELRTFLKDTYESVEKETGVFDKTDYISGALFDALKAKFDAVAANVPSVDEIEDAPLAVQAAPPASGLFSFDKWSSAPILVDAIREAASKPDWQRPLFYVPRAHVTKLHVDAGAVRTIELWLNGQQKFLNVSNRCAVVLANGTLEATRLAMESFSTALMGRNLMAHLRTNTVVRIHRSALGIPLLEKLQAAAVLVRGSTPQGRYHLQVTAAAVPGGSEDTMWRAIPDIELLDKMLANQREDWIVVTLRGIGEMRGDRDPNKPKNTGTTPSWMDLSDQTEDFPLFNNPPASQMRRAWINLVAGTDDQALWNTMDQAALALAKKLADDDPAKFKLVEQKRDGLGTTHHEAGTLWMGADGASSITDLEGRFHHVANAYVAGPALFPTLGSANPSLTALALARRTALAIVRDSLAAEPDFVTLGSGGLAGWQMAGNGGFIELGNNIIESDNGIGLLWFTEEQFLNFIFRADFRLSSSTDNSGIFIRIPALGTNDPANDWRPAAVDGYEIQIDNTGFNPDTNATGDALHATGAIYALAASSASMPAIGQWHTFEIEAVEQKITVRLNGQPVSQLTNGNRRATGFIGLQNHHAGSKVQFTRLRVKKLP
jgi:choline dehydrogenase-like flavoprotein